MKYILVLSIILIQIFTAFSAKKKEESKPEKKPEKETKIDELRKLTEESDNGIIDFQDTLDYERYAFKAPRKYYLIMYYTANNCGLCDNMEAELSKVASFYELSGHQYQKTNDKGEKQIPVFFGKITYSEEMRDSFIEMEFTSAPNIVVMEPKIADVKGRARKELLKTNKWHISHTDGHVTSQKLLEYINQRTGYDVQLFVPLSEKLQMLLYLIIVLIILAFVFYSFYDILLSPTFWFIGSFVIYVVCCSGIIYNVLHDVPLIQNGEWFTTQQRVQYGLEGYVMSGSIGLASLIFIFWNSAHKLVSDSPLLQRMLYISLFMGVTLLIWFVEDIYRRKGWYNPLFHPPDSYVQGSYLKDQGNSI